MVGDFNKKTSSSLKGRSRKKSTFSKRQTSSSGKNITSKKKWFYFLPFVLIVVLGFAQIYFSNKLATRGQQITIYEQEIGLAGKENKKLKGEIASSGSLNKLKEAAEEKGFVKTFKIVNLSTKIPVALNP